MLGRDGLSRGADEPPGEVVPVGVALLGEAVDDWASRIAEPEDLRGLVERLARRVVKRRAHDLGPAILHDSHKGGVPPRDDHPEDWIRLRILKQIRVFQE